MTPRKTWPLHVEEQRLEAIALISRTLTIDEQAHDIANDLVPHVTDEGRHLLLRFAQLNQLRHQKSQHAIEQLREARKA